MTAWTDLVQKIFKDKSSKNSSYKLKHAMKDAAKVYKKHGKTAKKVHGGLTCQKTYETNRDTCENDDKPVQEHVVEKTEEKPVEESVENTVDGSEEPPMEKTEEIQNHHAGGGKRKSKKAKKDKKRKSAKKSKK